MEVTISFPVPIQKSGLDIRGTIHAIRAGGQKIETRNPKSHNIRLDDPFLSKDKGTQKAKPVNVLPFTKSTYKTTHTHKHPPNQTISNNSLMPPVLFTRRR